VNTNPRGRFCALAIALALAGAAPPAPPEHSTVNRPEAARRIVGLFDFDRPEKFALPQHWDLAQDGSTAAGGARPGFPIYNGAEHDLTIGANAKGSVRLWTKGGSTCLRLSAGAIPVFPDTGYLVSAHVQTRGLSNARAAISTRYLDRSNAPIRGTEDRSELVVTDPGQWRTLVASLPTGFAEAAYIQVDLEILQPAQFQTTSLGAHQVWPQDFAGQAWFDDVSAVQLPSVEIATPSPINVLVGPQRPAIDVAIRDLTGEQMTGRLTLQDAAGRVVDQDSRPLEGGRSAWSWEPKIDRYGWYRAVLDLSTNDRRVGGTYIDLAWIPARTENAPSADRVRFGVLLNDLPEKDRDLVTELITACGTGSVTLPVWPRSLTAESAPHSAQGFGPLVSGLVSRGRRVAFSLTGVPDELAGSTHAERDNPISVFTHDQKEWAPYLVSLIDLYGQSVQRWQIGQPGSLAATQPGAASALAAAQGFLAKLVPGPTVEAPWPAELENSGALGPACGNAIMLVPSGVSIGDLAPALRDRAGPSAITLVPESLPEGAYSRQDAAVDLVKRTVEYWRSLVSFSSPARTLDASLAIAQPWSWPTPQRPQIMPRAELAALANLMNRLDGRRVLGVLPAGRGVTCYILSATPGHAGALVAWADAGAGKGTAIDACLGDGPVRVIDLWGNASTVSPAASGTGPRAAKTHHIPIGGEPVFIESVDVDLVRLVASFRLDPEYAESTGGDHDVTMLLTNPFRSHAEGRINILEPGGLSSDDAEGVRDRSWRITPRVSTFSIAPGQTVRIPLNIAFSVAEEAGPKPFIAEITFSADHDYPPVRLRTMFEIRMESLQLDLSYRFSPTATGPDLIVEAQATNRGKNTTTLELAAFAPGLPRAKASIADLAPGATALRRFSFPGAAAKLRGQKISVGMQDAETQARINRSIDIE
jgi:hypothetical protein